MRHMPVTCIPAFSASSAWVMARRRRMSVSVVMRYVYMHVNAKSM